MKGEHYRAAVRLFEEALQLAPAERERFLTTACGGDETLLAKVAAMLQQHDAPAIDLESIVAREVVPKRVGAYRVLGVLGAGGMGIVYRAEQERPRREVALKVIRTVGAPALVRRFEHEVEVLGRLNHPGIARIFDAGIADTGAGAQPYFAMELIEGRPLMEFAESAALSTPDRLSLLVEICEAVHHAHAMGVIHRDLKPANILVTDAGEPKVLDFGVARATDTNVQVTTMQTAVGQLVGTLPYMSPEQLAGDPEAIDARSDVYSLGILLYELLSGTLPHDLTGRTLTDTILVLADAEPRPLGRVDARWRGDLDAITWKAIERDRERRYQSAGAMAEDLTAVIENRPIAARAPGLAVRTRKWAERRPAVAALLIIVVVGLVVGSWNGALYIKRLGGFRDHRDRTVLPASVVLDALEANGEIWALTERRAVPLAADLDVDVTQVGTCNFPPDLTPGSIPAGTVVTSYLLHFDPPGTLAQTRNAVIEFDEPILGIIAISATLDASDAALGGAGTRYPTGDMMRGMEFVDRNDLVEIRDDRRTLRVKVNCMAGLDQIRVVTGTGPTPRAPAADR